MTFLKLIYIFFLGGGGAWVGMVDFLKRHSVVIHIFGGYAEHSLVGDR